MKCRLPRHYSAQLQIPHSKLYLGWPRDSFRAPSVALCSMAMFMSDPNTSRRPTGPRFDPNTGQAIPKFDPNTGKQNWWEEGEVIVAPAAPKLVQSTSMAGGAVKAFLLSVVNPKFANFNRPVLLCVLVGSIFGAAMYLFYNYRKSRLELNLARLGSVLAP